MVDNQLKKFNKFQEIFFPIYRHELKKFVPMSLLMFFIVFIYTLVRNLKDFFVHFNTNLWLGARPEETASLISALKFWYVLPCAFFTVIAFTTLLNKFGSVKAFYITVTIFMLFFFVYGFILYPNLDKIILSEEAITKITSSFPVFFRSFITCLANWPITLFYIASELWGTMGISFLFWQFAIQVTMNHEVKRFFGLLPLLSNFGGILAGSIYSNKQFVINIQSVKVLLSIVVISGISIMAIYTYIQKIVLNDPLMYDKNNIKAKKSNKEKISPIEGIKFLFKDTYFMLITILVLAYGICINFSEIIMVSCMKEVFTSSEYKNVQGNLVIIAGIFSVVIVLLSNNVLRRFSWKVGALVTPLCFLIGGGIFLSLVLYKQFISAYIFGMPAAIVAVWFGIFYDALAKGVKYSLFDSTKSMAYRPLDEERRNKGQAAVEIIGGRAGKATASIVQQILISFPRVLQTTTGAVTGLLAHSPTIITSFLATAVIWVFAVLKLSTKYEAEIKLKNSEEN